LPAVAIEDRPVASTTGDGDAVPARQCSRPACKRAAVCTLTYVYRDSTAVLGPLAAVVEPHCYDLCERHADRMTAPRGWDVVRLPVSPPVDAAAVADDLEALANAVREATAPPVAAEPTGQGIEVTRRGHLRVLRSAPSDGGGVS
jgi:Protein of unknown function (DUF3499)